MNYKKRKLKNNFSYNCIQKIKYLGINLTKKVKGIYAKKHKNHIKEIEECTNIRIKYTVLLDWKKSDTV